MTLSASQFETLDRLLFALCEGELTDDQVAELEQLVLGDPVAMRRYLHVTQLHVGLRWIASQEAMSEGLLDDDSILDDSGLDGDAMLSGASAPAADFEHADRLVAEDAQAAFQVAASAVAEPSNAVPALLPVVSVEASSAVRRPRVHRLSFGGIGALQATFGEYFIGGAASAVIMILLGVGAWMWKISDSKPVAMSERPAFDQSNFEQRQRFEKPMAAGDVRGRNAKQTQAPVFVGKIVAQSDCKWKLANRVENKVPRTTNALAKESAKQQTPSASSYAPVALGDRLVVTEGLMEIAYNGGAHVILQGPCTFNVGANGGFLAVGRLTGRLEKRGEGRGARGEGKAVGSGQWIVNNDRTGKTSSTLVEQRLVPTSTRGDKVSEGTLAVGSAKPQAASPTPTPTVTPTPFVIATPTAVITDLGTEFGVEVARNGRTVSHVFRGEVRIQPFHADGRAAGDAVVLHINESARTAFRDDLRNANAEKTANRIETFVASAEQTTAFIREIPKRASKTLDLVDVVAGGNGFSGHRGMGLNPLTGQQASSLFCLAEDSPNFTKGDGLYHRVEGLPFIDGIFVPNGTAPVQVDSAGHRFDDCGKTSGQTVRALWAGGVVPMTNSDRTSALPTYLGGVDYSTKEHGLLYMHTNKGLTFDLDAIRRANPGYEITRFAAIAGNVETASGNGGHVCADVWVLIDGQPQFRRRQFNAYNGAFRISVSIRPDDRFLTLITTDGGDGVLWDRIIFGDPRLELFETGVLPPSDADVLPTKDAKGKDNNGKDNKDRGKNDSGKTDALGKSPLRNQ